jgi:hypothetical protein
MFYIKTRLFNDNGLELHIYFKFPEPPFSRGRHVPFTPTTTQTEIFLLFFISKLYFRALRHGDTSYVFDQVSDVSDRNSIFKLLSITLQPIDGNYLQPTYDRHDS